MQFVSEGFFPLAIISFAITQICFTAVFGWESVQVKRGVALYILSSVKIVAIFSLHLRKPGAMHGVECGVTIGAVWVYCFLIYTAFWRSLDLRSSCSNTQWENNVANLRCIGMVLFVVSDSIIAVNKYALPIPHASLPIMATYYPAQSLIAYSEIQLLLYPDDKKTL